MNIAVHAIPLVVCLVMPSEASSAEPPLATTLYCRGETLPTTLLASRQRYREWTAGQPAARANARAEAWRVTAAMPSAVADRLVWETGGVDLNARLAGDRALWTLRDDLADGKAVPFLSGSTDTVAYLTRVIHADRPARLTVGIGGGDRLDVWHNGQKLASANTHLASGRYGTAERVDGTRVDQVLVDLDLQPGANILVIRLTLAGDPTFYFSLSPDAVPWLWTQLRRDFSPDENPLLGQVHASWFDTNGWFAAVDSRREERLIHELLADCGEGRTAIADEVDRLKEQRAVSDDPRWLALCVRASVLARLRGELKRLRSAVMALSESYGDRYPGASFLEQLDAYARELAVQSSIKLDPADEATRRLMASLAQLQRRMLVEQNPLLHDAELVFVKRFTYNSKHYYDDFQHISRWGGNLCVLSLSDGNVREIVPELAGGVFDRYDLSFDATRIVFGYRRPLPEGFRIYEIGTDGSGLRQVIPTPEGEQERIDTYGKTSTGDSFYGLQGYRFWTDDVHPCYLSDGGICFASTRCEHGVLCTPSHYLACTNLFRAEADGSGLRALSHGALSEFTPTMMEDGRILYNRWEYVYKGIAAVQPLWTARPDGSGSEEFYGDNISNPGVLWQARQVPGYPRLAVCIGCGHEPLGVGQVLLLDLNKNKRTLEPITSLTPEVRTEGLRGIYHLRNGVWREDIYGPLYADPYPLSDKFFLVSCNPDRRYNDESAYGIYLLDVFGNRVPIYQDPEFSCWQAMPLRPRTAPPVLPSIATAENETVAKARVFMSDVQRGLEDLPPGTVKYLRVLEQIPKPWAAEVDQVRDQDRSADGFGGHLAVSWNSHIWVAVLHGIVPVEEDGSAHFEVPARRNLFFQALDENYQAVQRMRTFVNFAPGEQRSCIGCHEPRVQAPASRATIALSQPPRHLAAQPGDIAPRPFHYPSDIQPMLDEHCVGCHNGTDPQAAPDLRGELTTIFNRSYENLLRDGWVHRVQEWDGLTYAMQNAEPAPPFAHGSHNSRLVDLLRAGHYECDLPREAWIKLVTWIDCGAPYYGSYFGRRNLMYAGQPDFRPVPTLESACGVPPQWPEVPAPDPLPARLLAWWRCDESAAGTVADASRNGHPGEAINIASTTGPAGRSAFHLDGTGYVECGGLGSHASISIALWVKPGTLSNAWNPLLFCHDGKPGAVHFSLLPDGIPNVAVNTTDWNWTHRRGRASLADGRWHHLVLVCDARSGGSVQFFVDGKRTDHGRLGVSLPLDLYRFRIGAWNRWAGNPANNFHGDISDVRIYSGMLSGQEVARLFAVVE